MEREVPPPRRVLQDRLELPPEEDLRVPLSSGAAAQGRGHSVRDPPGGVGGDPRGLEVRSGDRGGHAGTIDGILLSLRPKLGSALIIPDSRGKAYLSRPREIALHAVAMGP